MDGEGVLRQAAAWRDQGETVAIATVVECWGSSPRPAGSQMAVTRTGKMAGSVSGGCVEAAVMEAATQVLTRNQPALLEYGVSNEKAWEVGLACGGKLTVFLEPIA